MPDDGNRTLFVAWARQVASELADLAARGWEIAPPGHASGFVFRKTYALPSAGGGVTVKVREVRGPGGVRVQVETGDRELDLAADREAILALVEKDGYDELRRIHRLIVERLN